MSRLMPFRASAPKSLPSHRCEILCRRRRWTICRFFDGQDAAELSRERSALKAGYNGHLISGSKSGFLWREIVDFGLGRNDSVEKAHRWAARQPSNWRCAEKNRGAAA